MIDDWLRMRSMQYLIHISMEERCRVQTSIRPLSTIPSPQSTFLKVCLSDLKIIMKLSVVICFLLASLGQSFLPISRPCLRPTILSAASEEYAEEEIQEMRELVLSISMEPTDNDRRERLKEVFLEALARPNGAPKRFTDLFDMILVKVGDEIQAEAKKKYFEKQAKEKDLEEPVESEVVEEKAEEEPVETNPDDPPAKKGLQFKTPEEFQLWALVDMMVQSKTIVKKENGELGSKGSFQ